MFWAQGGGRRPGRRLTGADRTRVYSPAVSRVRVATPAAQSLEQRGGCAPGSVRLDPILAVSVPRPRKSDRRSTPPRDGTALATVRKDAYPEGNRTSVTAGVL